MHPTLETAPLESSDTKRALTLRDLGAPSWRLSVRLVAYLLRSFARRTRETLTDEYRAKNLPEELATAIRGEHHGGRHHSVDYGGHHRPESQQRRHPDPQLVCGRTVLPSMTFDRNR